MDTSADGTIEITIPRTLLDAKFESSDDIFFILVDGFETDYAEIRSGVPALPGGKPESVSVECSHDEIHAEQSRLGSGDRALPGLLPGPVTATLSGPERIGSAESL